MHWRYLRGRVPTGATDARGLLAAKDPGRLQPNLPATRRSARRATRPGFGALHAPLGQNRV